MRKTIFLLLAGIFICSGSAIADVTYQYTGANYVQVLPVVGSPYSTSMNVNGSFTVADVLPEYAVFTEISGLFLSYEFSDGVNIYSHTSSEIFQFQVITDSNGEILNWIVSLSAPSAPQPQYIDTVNFARTASYSCDANDEVLCTNHDINGLCTSVEPSDRNGSASCSSETVATWEIFDSDSPIANVPTLSQWGTIIFALLLSIAGIVWIKRSRRVGSRSTLV